MNGTSNNTKKTSVKIFFSIVASLLLAPQIGHAETTMPSFSSKDTRCAGFEGSDYQDCIGKLSSGDQCKGLQTQYNDAKKERAKLCKSAGAGNDCESKIEQCNEASSSESFNTLGALATAAGVNSSIGSVLNQVGAQQNQSSSGCPQFTAQDFWQKKDKYTDDLEKAEEDLAKLTDDRANAEEDFNKEINDLQEDLNKAQEDLDKAKLEIADKKRKQLQDFQSTQSSAKEELRKKGTEIMQLQGKLITSQRDKALKLIAMTDASGNRACKKAVNDAKKELTSSTSLNSSNMISKAKANKQALIDTYNDCMSAFQQQRVALLESKKQEQEEISKAIDDANEDMTSLQDSLSTAQSQLTEMQNDAATEQSNAEQKLVKIMQNTQNKMAAAKQKLQTKIQTITQKTQNYTEKINRLNNQLATLGTAPKSGATTTASEISGEFSDYTETMNDAVAQAKSSDLSCGWAKSLKREARASSTREGAK
ncbi:MAG: hypothetical protein ACKOX6_13480 [Bdellovibrio sp.]